MSEARHWNGFRLAVAWVAAVGSVALLRWALYAGVYRSTLEGGRVVHLGGMWPRSFATVMTVVAAGAALALMGWVTWNWVDGRRARAAWRSSETAGHRRVIM